MAHQPTLLMVEDSASLSSIYKSYLEAMPVNILHSVTLKDASELCARMTPDLILLDIELPDGSGMDLLRNLSDGDVNTHVIVMTAHGSSDMAVEAIRLGAFDFLTKPFDAGRLQVTINNALEHMSLSEKVDAFKDIERERYGEFIGHSLSMQAVYRIIDSVAVSDATAFIVGESGTGKELAARAIHSQSKRREKHFHAINCGAIPGELMESELFGHVKGAFTGATSSREGAATMADGGTLFLDEICEMDLELQKKLLRFIQSGEFQRVGSNRVERADIRFVCATNRDPLEEVRAGRFREDLYYRLHVVPIEMPPLRDRGDDVVAIAEHFLEQISAREGKTFSAFSSAALDIFLEHSWPGNVRELENTIQNIVVLNTGDVVTPDMLPSSLAVGESQQPEPQAGGSSPDLPVPGRHAIRPLWVIEKRAIESAIELCDGNINLAAGLLEVAPSTIYRKLQGWKRLSEQTG